MTKARRISLEVRADTAGSNKEDPALHEIDTARSAEQESGANPSSAKHILQQALSYSLL